MKPRLFLAGLAQETNAFGPLPTGMRSFSGRFDTPLGSSNTAPPYPEALLDHARALASAGRITVVEGPAAGAHPSGLVTRAAYEALRDHLLHRLARALPVDAVALHLHGAMSADGYPDCEGDLLTGVRALVGPGIPVGAMIDPHAHLSPAMVAAAEIIVAYKEYPHTDFRERAVEVIDLLLAVQARKVRPTAAVWDTGVIGVFHTHLAPVRALVERMQQMERSGEALTASLVHGFPWGDAEDLGTRALVVTDGDPTLADRLARELAEAARTIVLAQTDTATTLDRAIDQLSAWTSGAGPVVWADGADNPGGGAAGDATYVVRALLQHGVVGACLGPLWDPQAVEIAFDAGLGARLPMRIGGKAGGFSGQPVDCDAEVIALDPDAGQTFAGERFSLGRTAAIRTAGIDIVLASVRDQARGTDMFTNLGLDLADKRLVVVKSSQHFYDSFAGIAAAVVYLQAPGGLQSDLSQYPYARVRRPRWPIDRTSAAPPWRVVAAPSLAPMEIL